MQERQEATGDYCPTVTAAGTRTSQEELLRAGATSFDTPQQVELKLTALRAATGTLISPTSTLNARPANRMRARTLGLVALVILAWFAFQYFEPRGPWEWDKTQTLSSVSESDKANPVTKEQYLAQSYNFADKFQAKFGHLYTEDAPVETYYESCRLKGCWSADMGVFESFKKFAKSQDSYWNDVCTAVAKDSSFDRGDYFEPSWKISTKGGDTICTLQNADEMAERYLQAKSRYNNLLAGAIGLAVLLLAALLWRKTKNLPH